MHQDLLPEDRLILLGDGVGKPDGLPQDERIEWHSLPHVGNYGFPHLERLMREPLAAYVTILDDDDAWLPGAFRAARPLLDGGTMVCFSKVHFTGELIYWEWKPSVGHVGGLKAFVPWHDKLSLFHDYSRWSDGLFWRGEARKHPLRLLATPAQLTYASHMGEEQWDALGMSGMWPWPPPSDSRSAEELKAVLVW